jgi:hypothetical protein
VGYRLEAGDARFFHIPDVLDLHHRRAALEGVQLYVGDGATYGRATVREREGHRYGMRRSRCSSTCLDCL